MAFPFGELLDRCIIADQGDDPLPRLRMRRLANQDKIAVLDTSFIHAVADRSKEKVVAVIAPKLTGLVWDICLDIFLGKHRITAWALTYQGNPDHLRESFGDSVRSRLVLVVRNEAFVDQGIDVPLDRARVSQLEVFPEFLQGRRFPESARQFLNGVKYLFLLSGEFHAYIIPHIAVICNSTDIQVLDAMCAVPGSESAQTQ